MSRPRGRRPRAIHVLVKNGGKTYHCTHCDQEASVELPMSIPVWVAAADAFVKLHEKCKEKK